MSLTIKIVSAIIQALVCGSLFYDLPNTSQSIFRRPGVLYFPVLYFLLEGLSETVGSFRGRPILARQKRLAFFRPTAFCIANAITDLPVVFIQVTCFSLILYFMSALQTDPGKFFTFFVIVFFNNVCFAQLFRCIGAIFSHFGTASQLSGLLSTVAFTYGGYLIPFGKMHPWFKWIFYLNPASYAFESIMANEFQGLELQCVAPQLIPYGPGYDSNDTAHTGCTVVGSDENGVINGLDYVRNQYGFEFSHVWRGFGVIVALWIFFIAVTSLAFELKSADGGSSVLLYKRGRREADKVVDPEKGAIAANGIVPDSASSSSVDAPTQTTRQATFTWHDLDYFVKAGGSQKQLLNHIFGYVQPGNLTALMGASGAGKTT